MLNTYVAFHVTFMMLMFSSRLNRHLSTKGWKRDAFLGIPPLKRNTKGLKKQIKPLEVEEEVPPIEESPIHTEMMSVVKKHGQLHFISYYHRMAGIPLPSSQRHKMKTARDTTHSIITPSHRILGADVNKSTLKFICNKKLENAGTFIQTKLCLQLLRNVNVNFVNEFALSAR